MARTFGKIVLTITLVLFYISATTQTITPFTSAYQSGMLTSDQFSTDQADFSVQPSVLSKLESPIVSGNVQSLYTGFGVFGYGLHFASALPGHFGAGLSVLSLGHPDYNTTEIIQGLARQLGPYLSIGITHRFRTTKVANEGRPWSGSSSVGGVFDKDSWGVGLHLTGLMQWNKSSYPEEISIHASSYVRLQSRTHLYLALTYSDKRFRPVTGIRQRIIKNIELFGAFQWYPARHGVGFIVPLADQIESIVSTTYHPVLGWSPSLGLRWSGRKRQDTSSKMKDTSSKRQDTSSKMKAQR